ncbi:MAG: 2-C-methyl-D-erythritol 2,4-cyclodiphosphate synthase [Oscillospiraceae bacterium]|nr:2-C-methyl-D-erythritol 2,4-cyclodiphosphate synthase [Oscillospiraceae bacterium]
MEYRVGIGQDSHRFAEAPSGGQGGPNGSGGFAGSVTLGGVAIPHGRPLEANSDGDAVLHAVTDAISGVTCVNVLGAVADAMCAAGVRDSAEYVREAMRHLGGRRIGHVSISVRCASPILAPHIPAMRANVASICGVTERDVGITATSGEGMGPEGKGEGIHAMAVITVVGTSLPS